MPDRQPDHPAPEPRMRPRAGFARRGHVGLDGFERGVLLAFAAVSVWVLALDVWQVLVHGRTWTGTDGLFLTDQMQYLAWIRSASRQVLVSDLFVLHPTAADYLQPLVVISGALTALGVAAWLSLLVWQPVAVLAMFFAVRAYARASLTSHGARRAALAIGLFGGSLPAIGDLWPGFWSWGYPYALLAIAAVPGALVLYDRARTAGRFAWTPAALGALAAWLHPWQGETLILIVLGTELASWRATPPPRLSGRVALPAVTVLATALPLLYIVVLAHADGQWALGQAQSKHTIRSRASRSRSRRCWPPARSRISSAQPDSWRSRRGCGRSRRWRCSPPRRPR